MIRKVTDSNQNLKSLLPAGIAQMLSDAENVVIPPSQHEGLHVKNQAIDDGTKDNCGLLGADNAVKDTMEDLYESMKKMNTEDEGTKRFLLALHYINCHCSGREVILNGRSGDITFPKNF